MVHSIAIDSCTFMASDSFLTLFINFFKAVTSHPVCSAYCSTFIESIM